MSTPTKKIMGIDTIDPREEIAKRESARATITSDLAELEISPETLNPKLLGGLERLAADSNFYEHSQHTSLGLQNVLKNFGASPETIHDARFAALLHDSGKTGPPGASPAEQKTILDLYNINVPYDTDADYNSLKVGDVARNTARLERCGIEPQMSIRKFWDNHSRWTSENLQAHPEGISDEVRILAASHHAYKKDPICNPYQLETKGFPFALKAMFAIDNTEAAFTRSNLSLPEAIARAERIINKNAELEKDPEMQNIFKAIKDLAEQGNFLLGELHVEKGLERKVA